MCAAFDGLLAMMVMVVVVIFTGGWICVAFRWSRESDARDDPAEMKARFEEAALLAQVCMFSLSCVWSWHARNA